MFIANMNISIFFFTILANPLPMPYLSSPIFRSYGFQFYHQLLKKNWHRRLPSQTIHRIFRSKIRTTLSKIAQVLWVH
ncbi:hypothetical protein Hanom_Chr17g01526201 [Helianthus anomalus]